MVFIDVGGLGAGVVDRLNELGYAKRITAVNFGGKAADEEKHPNMRSQMWCSMEEWLADHRRSGYPRLRLPPR